MVEGGGEDLRRWEECEFRPEGLVLWVGTKSSPKSTWDVVERPEEARCSSTALLTSLWPKCPSADVNRRTSNY